MHFVPDPFSNMRRCIADAPDSGDYISAIAAAFSGLASIEEFPAIPDQNAQSHLARNDAHSAIGEIAVSESGEITVYWLCTPAGFPVGSPALLRQWYARARLQLGTFVPAPMGEWSALLSASPTNARFHIALFMRTNEVPLTAERPLAAFLDVLAIFLLRLRERNRLQASLRAVNDEENRNAAWLSASADILWEATPDGVVHCKRILNGRADLASLIEGKRLDMLHDAESGKHVLDLLRSGANTRALEVRIPGADGHGLVSLSIRARPENGELQEPIRGSLSMLTRSCASGGSFENGQSGLLRLLDIVRILLVSEKQPDLWLVLAPIAAAAMGSDDMRVAHLRSSGAVQVYRNAQTQAEEKECAALIALIGDTDATGLCVYQCNDETGRALRMAFGLRGRQILALALPSSSGPAFLLCSSRDNAGFDIAQREEAEKFVALFRHASLLKEDREMLAERAKRAVLEKIAPVVSRELDGPLESIRKISQAFADGKIDPHTVRYKAERLLRIVDRAHRLIGRLSDFAPEIAFGAPERGNVLEIVSAACAALEPMLSQRGIRLSVAVPADIFAYVDSATMEQTLIDILRNAADAVGGIGTQRSAPDGIISIRGAWAPDVRDEVHLWVEDNGPGFPEDMLRGSLEIFTTTKNRETGAGLSLAIADAFVREQNGRLEFGNHADGAFVLLRLPGGRT